MTTVTQIITAAAHFGIIGKKWATKDGSKLRIYADAKQKGMKVYLDLDGTESDLTGARLAVECHTENVSGTWKQQRIEEFTEHFKGLFFIWIVCNYLNWQPGDIADISNNTFRDCGPSITECIQAACDWVNQTQADRA